MSTTTRISTAERFGRAVGRVWRAYVRGERRVSHWLTTKGMPVAGATALVWAVKLVVMGVLLYVASWFFLLLVFVVVAAWATSHVSDEDDILKYEYPEQEDYRDRLFYDPIEHNDYSDPRFDDPESRN
ncbi:DUF3742 family protein [Pseudomonas aeruginosa]|nr:DUF3742 family protein [Pseudomonas aeruginosa]HEI8721454.1 DUF3742 family protein [Serratia marcescens]